MHWLVVQYTFLYIIFLPTCLFICHFDQNYQMWILLCRRFPFGGNCPCDLTCGQWKLSRNNWKWYRDIWLFLLHGNDCSGSYHPLWPREVLKAYLNNWMRKSVINFITFPMILCQFSCHTWFGQHCYWYQVTVCETWIELCLPLLHYCLSLMWDDPFWATSIGGKFGMVFQKGNYCTHIDHIWRMLPRGAWMCAGWVCTKLYPFQCKLLITCRLSGFCVQKHLT